MGPVDVNATARTRLGFVAVAASILLASALAGGPAPAGATDAVSAPQLSEPPTRAEVRSWEADFLASEGADKGLVPAPAKAPGKRLFPQNHVLSLYGAAGGFGVLGRKSLNGAAKRLKRQIKPYRKRSHERVINAFDLVVVIATQCNGRHDECRTRVGDSVIRKYLNKIRELNGRLILDIQPARSNVLDEIGHLRKWISEPDVDVAIDAEWNVGEHEEPGEDLGSITATRLNRATKKIRGIVNRKNLPPKLLIVHQFRKGSVKSERKINRSQKVDLTLNFDGIGSPSAKKSAYKRLSTKRLFNGFSLFYQLDDNLMSPRAVLGLRPKPDYIMYQ